MSFVPVEIVNPGGAFPAVLTVDHGGAQVPAALGDLGLPPAVLASHHALDRGIAACARTLAARLDATVVICHASRLVIDCNRWIDDPRSILSHAGTVPIPANRAVTAADREARQEGIFWPYHRAVGDALDAAAARGRRPMLLALHSFVRWFDGARRPWDAGTLWNDGRAMAAALLGELARTPGLTLGDNQPYSGRQGLLGVDLHCHGQGIAGCGLEIADDGLETVEGRDLWAGRLDRALRALVSGGVAA